MCRMNFFPPAPVLAELGFTSGVVATFMVDHVLSHSSKAEGENRAFFWSSVLGAMWGNWRDARSGCITIPHLRPPRIPRVHRLRAAECAKIPAKPRRGSAKRSSCPIRPRGQFGQKVGWKIGNCDVILRTCHRPATDLITGKYRVIGQEIPSNGCDLLNCN